VTGLADGLEQKGYIVRYENDQDRRIKMLKLTPKGQSLRKKYSRELMSEETPIISALDPDERVTLLNLFEKVLAHESI
jgi:DNA-binding MarR family transcriptional regulator